MRQNLERFFNPRSIAVIGASQDLITISGQPLQHLISHGYAGQLYPVNPKYQEILGVKSGGVANLIGKGTSDHVPRQAPFDKFSANGNMLIPFVVSLSNHIQV